MTSLSRPQNRTGVPPSRKTGMRAFFSSIPTHIWVPIIVAYACLLPREMTVEIAGLAFFPYRACLFIFLPYALAQIRYVPKLSMIDLFAAFASLWHLIALLMNEPIATAFVRGGAQAADFGLAYLIGRTTLRSVGDLRLMFLALLPGLCVTGLFMIAESLSGQMIVRPFVAKLFGQGEMTSVYERFRMGLFRASGPFPHPILAGVFLSSLLPLAWHLPKSNLVRAIAVAASLCCIFTVSSATVVAMGLSIALMVMHLLQRVTRLPVFIFAIIYSALAFTAVSAVSKSGAFSVFRRYVMLDQGSQIYREWIWQYAGAETLNNPIFGIGLRDWERPSYMSTSVDSFWLVSAMMFGIPLAVAAALTIGGTVGILATRLARAPIELRNAAFAVAASLFVLMFCGFTVHLWEGVACWMLLLTGAGVTLSQWRSQVVLPQRRAVQPQHGRLAGASYGRQRAAPPMRQARSPE